MNRFLLFILSVLIFSISSHGQSRSERVSKIQTRTKALNPATEERLIKEATLIKDRLPISDLRKQMLCRAFAKDSTGKISNISIDCAKPIRDIRIDVNNSWNNSKYRQTYFAYFVMPLDYLSQPTPEKPPTKKSVGIEIEDSSITGTVAVLFDIERKGDKWVYVKSNPRLIYMERPCDECLMVRVRLPKVCNQGNEQSYTTANRSF